MMTKLLRVFLRFSYIIAAVFVIISSGSAQITITDADMPEVDDTIRISRALSFTADPAITGAGFTWDFSDLVVTDQRLDTFVSVLSTPISYNWIFNNQFLYPPSASIAQPTDRQPASIPGSPFTPQIEITETFDYFREESSSFSRLGFASKFNGVPLPMKYDNPEIFYEFPLAFGNSFSSVSYTSNDIPTLGYYGQLIDRVSEVDGWGTLILPTGTFDVLRVKTIVNTTDTIYLDSLGFGFNVPRPETTEYRWMSPGCKIPQLQIDASNMSEVAYYQDPYIPLGNRFIDIKADGMLKVFPNPVRDVMNISYSAESQKGVSIKLADISGKVVYKRSCTTDITGCFTMQIDIRKLKLHSGSYFVTVESESDVLYRKLFVL